MYLLPLQVHWNEMQSVSSLEHNVVPLSCHATVAPLTCLSYKNNGAPQFQARYKDSLAANLSKNPYI